MVLLFQQAKRSQNKQQNVKISENIRHIVRGNMI